MNKKIYIVITFLVFIYLVLRAIYVPLFNDEVITFNHFIRTGFVSPYNEYKAANNHILNSFLSHYSYLLFGSSPLSLRLSSVLSFIPFAIYTYKIGGLIKSNLGKWIFYIALLIPVNFIAFFALSRGYGLSYAFIMMSIYYTYKTFEINNLKNVFWSLLFANLAMYANFSMLLFTLITFAILAINIYTKNKSYLKLKQIIQLILLVILFILSITYTLKVLFFYKENGILWWGYLNGFWEDTVVSLIDLFFRTKNYSFLIQIFIVVITAITFFAVFLKTKLNTIYNKTNLFIGILVLNIIGILLMALLFKVNYPFERTGLHLYLFYVGAICFSIDKINYKPIKLVFAISIAGIVIHSLTNLNLSYVSQWEDENLPLSFLDKVEELEKKEKRDHTPSLYIEGTTHTTWNYHALENQRNVPKALSNSKDSRKYYDYIIDKKENIGDAIKNYDSIDNQKYTNINLYKRKSKTKLDLITEFNKNDFEGERNSDFIFSKFSTDSLNSTTLFFDLEIELDFKEFPLYTYLVFVVENKKKKKKYGYKFFDMDKKGDWKKGEKFNISEIISNIPKNETVEVAVYFWNRYKVKHELHSSKLGIYEVLN